MNSILSLAKSIYGIAAFPLAASIERQFRKHGPTLGTVILTFWFVNLNWLLFVVGIGLQNLLQTLYPPISRMGFDLAASVLLLLGNYFYAFPLAGFLVLGWLLASPHAVKAHENRHPIYLLLDYLCCVVPPAVWIFTYFSYRIAAVLHQIPVVHNGSFFLEQNFKAYAGWYFPFLSSELSIRNPMLYFSLWGFVFGMAGSVSFLKAELFSSHASGYKQRRQALVDDWTPEEIRYNWQLLLLQAGLVAWLILGTAFTHPDDPSVNRFRFFTALFLLLPVFFKLGLLWYKKR